MPAYLRRGLILPIASSSCLAKVESGRTQGDDPEGYSAIHRRGAQPVGRVEAARMGRCGSAAQALGRRLLCRPAGPGRAASGFRPRNRRVQSPALQSRGAVLRARLRLWGAEPVPGALRVPYRRLRIGRRPLCRRLGAGHRASAGGRGHQQPVTGLWGLSRRAATRPTDPL